VFAPSILAVFGEGSPADRLSDFANLEEYALLHQAALWARGERLSLAPVPGDGTVTAAIGDAWRGILLRRPRWRAERELRAETEDGAWPHALVAELGEEEPGRVRVDLVKVDARPGVGIDAPLALELRDGSDGPALAEALGRLPGYAHVGRRYRRVE
jgi:hypothetical protein